ncbi:hypothetical protein PHLCEN_2v9678 [Hermanssonia centrifuga]|uniref:Tr-type G domain-containing protein n=1 Tax=Hermanssonia centrifuga TaxID=98765 RepID=A0A2R6NQT5_9APHY|nr:hypothetical protein PHLCEN_2v9678 [Hermanssonia centrifuga]
MAKQRTQALTERDKEKEGKKPVMKPVEDVVPSEPKKDEDTDLSDLEGRIQVRIVSKSYLVQDVEYVILETLLLSPDPPDRDRARDTLASLLTRRRGEYIFRIGSRPLNAKLFAGEVITASDGTHGIPRTLEEIETLCSRIDEVVDEFGGKVSLSHAIVGSILKERTNFARKTSVLYRVDEPLPHAALLLRLPAPSVALTPEVRCAVVGNVDSGKSTTLGVLTRGLFPLQELSYCIMIQLGFSPRCVGRWTRSSTSQLVSA